MLRVVQQRQVIPYVENLIARGACLQDAAYGAGAAGNTQLAVSLIEQGVNLLYVLMGAASSDQDVHLESLIKKNINEAEEGIDKLSVIERMLSAIAFGIAFTGDLEKLKIIIAKGGRGSIGGAALGNHSELVDYLISIGANYKHGLDWAALGGNMELVNKFCKLPGSKVRYVFQGASRGGQVNLLNEMMPYSEDVHSSFFYAIRGAAQGDHLKLMENMIHRYDHFNKVKKGEFREDFLIRVALEEIISNRHFLNEITTLRFLTKIESPALRIRFAKNTPTSHAELHDPKVTIKLLSKADQIDRVMQQKDLDFNQGIAAISPEIQGLFLFAVSTPGFSLDLFFIVAMYLVPIKQEETRELYTKMIEKKSQNEFKFPSNINKNIFKFFSNSDLDQTKLVSTKWKNHSIEASISREEFKRDNRL